MSFDAQVPVQMMSLTVLLLSFAHPFFVAFTSSYPFPSIRVAEALYRNENKKLILLRKLL